MGRFAVVSDIHGNLVAWQAVRADLATLGVDAVYCLGDLVGKGPQGAEVIDSCRQHCTTVVRGNWDDAVSGPVSEQEDAADGLTEALRWHRAQLGSERLAYLAGLPNCIDLTVSGRRLRLFHASAVGVDHRVFLGGPEAEVTGMFDNTPFTGFDRPQPAVVGCGDLHGSYLLPVGSKTLFNVGSVGNPLDDTTACYAVVEGDLGSDREGPFAITFRRVPYDIEAAIDVARRLDMPDLRPYAIELRTAVYRREHAERSLTAHF